MEGARRCIDGGDHSVKTQRESEVVMEEEKCTTVTRSTTGGDVEDEGDAPDGDREKESRSPVAVGVVDVSGAAGSKEDIGDGHTGDKVDIVQGSEGETLTSGTVEAVSHLTPDVCHVPAAPEHISVTVIGSGDRDKSLQTGNASDDRSPDSCDENTAENDAMPETLTQSDIALEQPTEGEREETTPVESDTVVEEATQKEIDIKVEETTPIGNDGHKEETLPKETDPTVEDRSQIESDVRTEGTTPRESYTDAEETTPLESDRRGEETAPVVSDINTAEITQIENDIYVKEMITTEGTTATTTDTCIEETPPVESVSLEEEAIPVQDEKYAEETTIETDIGAKETKPVECAEETKAVKSDASAEETTTPESDIRAEETTPPESDIRAEETTPPESDIRAEETTPPESDIRAEETTPPESDIRAEETTTSERDIRAEETTPPESDIRAEETTPPESDIRAEERTPPESDIRAEETITPESDIRAEETTTPESDIRAEETTPPESDIRAEETTPPESDIRAAETTTPESDIRAEETTPPESDIHAEETTTPESDIHAEETTPQQSDIHAKETTPQQSDIHAKETTPQQSDIRAKETTPQQSDIRAEETTPIESDTLVEDTTIIESDTHVEKTTPTASDTATEETTPVESDNHQDETTPVESGTKETKPTENDIQLAATTLRESDILAKETTPTESDTNTEKTTPLIKSDAALEETTPTQTDTPAEETPAQESDTCAEETTPIVSDTYTEETESETHNQHFLDDSYTEESDTVSEYPATTESSETLSSSGFEDTHPKYKVTDATPDAEQKSPGSKKQTPDEDAARETSSNEGQSSPNDTRTREISKTVRYKEKKSSSSDVTTEQLVEEAITGDDGITVRSHEMEEERHQTEQEESINMKASVVVVDGVKMEDEERNVRYEEAESTRKEMETEEEIMDTDGTVLGRCRSKYTQHTHSSDSHSVSSRRTALSTDDPTDVRDTPDPSQASTTLSEDGITVGGATVLSDISEADENDPAACGDFDTSPEANAMRNARRKKGTDGGKCKVITGRDERWEAGMKPAAAGSREQTWAGPSSGHTSTDDEGIFSQQEDAHQSESAPWGEGRHVNAHQTGAISGSGDSDKVLSQPSVDVPDPPAQSLPCLPGRWDRSSPTVMAEEQSSVSRLDSCRGNGEENPSDEARQEQTREEKSENPIYASGGDDGLEATVDTVEQVRKTTYERSHVSSESASVSGSQRTGEGGDVVERVQQTERTEEMVHKETRVSSSRSVVDTVRTNDIHIETPQKTQDIMVDIDSDDSLKQMAKDSQDDITDDTPGTEECPTSGVDSKEIDSGDISDNDDGSSSSSVGDTKSGVYTGDACGDTTEVSQVSPDDSELIKPAADMPDDESECHRDEEEQEQSEEQSPDADDERTADDTPKVIGDSDTAPCKDNHTEPATTTDSDVITSEEPETRDGQREETKPVLEPETRDGQREKTKPVSPVSPVNLGERKGQSLGDLSRLDDFVAEGDMKKEGREAGRRVSRRDVHEAMRTLKQRSKSADRRPRPQSYHGNREAAIPRGRHYDWNTYHFFPDNADSVPFIADRRRRRSQGAQYVDEEWIRDLYYYKQLEIEKQKQALLNDDDVFVTRRFRSETDMQVTPLTPADAVTDGNGNVRPCDSESSGESSENEQKRWHKSALHVKKTKRKENRIQNDDDDDEEIPVHISPVLSAVKASPSVRRREHKRMHGSSPWRGNATGVHGRMDDSGQGDNSSNAVRDNQQRFEMLLQKRRDLESTSEESMTSPRGVWRTVQAPSWRRCDNGRAPSSRSQEDVCFEERGGPFTVPGDFNWRHELRVPKGKTATPNRPQKPHHPSVENGRSPRGDHRMRVPLIPKCQYDFVSMEDGRTHYIAEGGFYSPAFDKRNMAAPRCEFSSSFENIYDRVNLSAEVPSLTKNEHDRYQQMRREYLRSKKQQLLGPPPPPPVNYRSIHHEDVAPRRGGGRHADNQQEPNPITTTHAPSVGSGNKFRVRDRDIAPPSGTTSSGSENYGPCIFALGYRKADGASSPASQTSQPTSHGDRPASREDRPTSSSAQPDKHDLTDVCPRSVDGVATSPLGDSDHAETRTLDAKQLMLEESQRYSEYKAEYLRRRRSEHGSSVSSGDELRSADGHPIIPPDEYEYVLRRRLCDKHATQGVGVNHQRQANYDGGPDATSPTGSKRSFEGIEHVEPRIMAHAVRQVDQRRPHGQVGKDHRKDPVAGHPRVETTHQRDRVSSQETSPPVHAGGLPSSLRFKSSDSQTSPRFQPSVSQTSPRHESTVSETSPRFESSVSQTSSRFESSVSQTSPRHEYTVSETSPRFESSVSQTSPRFQPSVSQTSPRLQPSVSQTSPRFQPSVSQTSPRFQPSVSQTSSRLQSNVSQTSPWVQPSKSIPSQSTGRHVAARPSDQYDRTTVQPGDIASTTFDREYNYDSWRSYSDSTRRTPREHISSPKQHGHLNGHGNVGQTQPRDLAHRVEYSSDSRPSPALWQDGLVSGARPGPKPRKQKQRPHSDYWATSASSPQISSPDRVTVVKSSQRTSSEVNLDHRTTVSSKWPDLLREHREVDSVHRGAKRPEPRTAPERTGDRGTDGERATAAADRYESYVRERRRNYMAKNSAEISSGGESCTSPDYVDPDTVRQRKQQAGSDVEHAASSPDDRKAPLFFPRTASDGGRRTTKPDTSVPRQVPVARSRSEDSAGDATPSVAAIKAALFGEVDPGLPPPVVTASHPRWETTSTRSAGSATSGTANCFQFLPLRRYDNDSDDDVRLVDYASFRDGRRWKKPTIIDDLTELEEAYERLDLDNEQLLDRAARRDYPRPLPPAPDAETNVKRLSITNLKKLDEIQQRVENPSLEYAKRWLSSESGLVEPARDVTATAPPAPVTSLPRGPRSSSLPRKFGDDMAVRKYRRSASGRSNGSHVTSPPTSYAAYSPSLTPAPSVDSISRRSQSGRAHTPDVRTGSDVDYLVNRSAVPVLRTRPASEADIYHDDFAYRQLRRDVSPRQRSQSVERPVNGQQTERRNSLGATSADGRPFVRRKSLSHGVASMVELFTMRPSLSAPDLSEKSVFSGHYNCRGDLVTDDPKYSRYALPPRRQQTPRIVKQRHELRSRLRQANGTAPEPVADVSRGHRSPPDGALDVSESSKTKVSGSAAGPTPAVVTDVGRYKVQMKTARTTPEVNAQPTSGKIVWRKTEGPLLPDYPQVKMVTVPVAVNGSGRSTVFSSNITAKTRPDHVITTRPDYVSTTRADHVITTRPDYVSTTRADHVITTRPDYVSTSRADHVTTTRPDYVSTTRPDHVITTRPDFVSTSRADHVTTTRPDYVTTSRADHVSTTPADHVTTTRPDYMSTTRADHVITTRADHVTTTRPDYVTTSRSDHVTTTRPDHVSTTRPDHVSTARADHVSAALEYKAKAAELDRRLTQLKETLSQTGRQAPSAADRRTTTATTTSETQRLEALMADWGMRAPVAVSSSRTSTNYGDYKHGATLTEPRVAPVAVSPSFTPQTSRAYGDGRYGPTPAAAEPRVSPDVPRTMPGADRAYADGRYGPPHAFAESRLTVNVSRQPTARRFEPAPAAAPGERCWVGASPHGGDVYRRRQTTTTTSRYESDGEMTDATDTTLDVLVRRNTRPSSTDTFDFSELDVASVTSGDDDLDRLKQYCRADPASWSQPIGVYSSSGTTATARVTETSSTTRLMRHTRTEEVVQRAGAKVDRKPSFKELVHTFEEQSSAFLRAPIRLNTAVAQGDA